MSLDDAGIADERLTVVVLARSALTAAPVQELERTCKQIASSPGVERAIYAFSELSRPTLREVIDDLVKGAVRQVLILPFLMPAEPQFKTWFTTILQRWRAGDDRPWPQIRVAQLVSDHPAMADVLGAIVQSGGEAVDMSKAKVKAPGSVVPDCKRCVLVCRGGACNLAGAPVVWGHLRNEQDRLSLRTSGEGTFLVKTSCLGPCSLAPVVQVWPDGTFYGGIDESGIDRIIQHHLFRGRVVEELAYPPNGRKQFLRS